MFGGRKKPEPGVWFDLAERLARLPEPRTREYERRLVGSTRVYTVLPMVEPRWCRLHCKLGNTLSLSERSFNARAGYGAQDPGRRQ